MKTNSFEKSIGSKAGAKNSRGAPAFLKKKQMFINSNISFQKNDFNDCSSYSPRGFLAAARGEYGVESRQFLT